MKEENSLPLKRTQTSSEGRKIVMGLREEFY